MGVGCSVVRWVLLYWRADAGAACCHLQLPTARKLFANFQIVCGGVGFRSSSTLGPFMTLRPYGGTFSSGSVVPPSGLHHLTVSTASAWNEVMGSMLLFTPICGAPTAAASAPSPPAPPLWNFEHLTGHSTG